MVQNINNSNINTSFNNNSVNNNKSINTITKEIINLDLIIKNAKEKKNILNMQLCIIQIPKIFNTTFYQGSINNDIHIFFSSYMVP